MAKFKLLNSNSQFFEQFRITLINSSVSEIKWWLEKYFLHNATDILSNRIASKFVVLSLSDKLHLKIGKTPQFFRETATNKAIKRSKCKHPQLWRISDEAEQRLDFNQNFDADANWRTGLHRLDSPTLSGISQFLAWHLEPAKSKIGGKKGL